MCFAKAWKAVDLCSLLAVLQLPIQVSYRLQMFDAVAVLTVSQKPFEWFGHVGDEEDYQRYCVAWCDMNS